MRRAYWLSGAIGALALIFMTIPGQAASVSGAIALKAAIGEQSDVQNVHVRRRCWRHRGHWHCRRYVRYTTGTTTAVIRAITTAAIPDTIALDLRLASGDQASAST